MPNACSFWRRMPLISECPMLYEPLPLSLIHISNEEPASPAPALMSLDTPPYITDELAHLLATNQADSIMGSFGITRSEACSMVQAVFDVSDYSGKATVDANYAELWAALESEFRVLSEQGCDCLLYTSILWRSERYPLTPTRRSVA